MEPEIKELEAGTYERYLELEGGTDNTDLLTGMTVSTPGELALRSATANAELRVIHQHQAIQAGTQAPLVPLTLSWVDVIIPYRASVGKFCFEVLTIDANQLKNIGVLLKDIGYANDLGDVAWAF